METLREALVVEKTNACILAVPLSFLVSLNLKNIDKVKSFLVMLEEEQILCDILGKQENDGVIVTIYGENQYSGIKDCSMVQATYRMDGQVVGTVAVLGPTRMDYGKVMSVLGYMHQHLGEVLKKYKV